MCVFISSRGHEFVMELKQSVEGVEGVNGRDGNELRYKILKIIKNLND